MQTQFDFDAIQLPKNFLKTCISANKACDLFGSGLLYGYDFLHLRHRLKLNKQPYIRGNKAVSQGFQFEGNQVDFAHEDILQQADLGLAHVKHTQFCGTQYMLLGDWTEGNRGLIDESSNS